MGRFHRSSHRLSIQAFTLLELSVVAVILALLTGGILAGRSLIRSAELQAIVTEAGEYTVAISAFKVKYSQLPGDFANAYQIWGATCGTNTTALSTGCNGDGDRSIESYGNDGAGNVGENVKAWEHLARAGMIEGSYDGTGTDGGGMVVLSSLNIPASKFSAGYWDVSNNVGNINGSLPAFGLGTTSKTILSLGGIGSTDTTLNLHPTLTRAEAWGIDTKSDDGRANTGAMRGDGGAECADNGTDYYNLQGTLVGGDHNSTDCILHFLL